MPLILNIHTPSTSYALPYRKNESSTGLVDRIVRKSGLDEKARSGVLLQYEYEGGRWTLQDDDDLEIMLSRYPVEETPSITIHLTPPPPSNGAPNYQTTSTNSLYSAPRQKKPSGLNGILNKNPSSSTSTTPNNNHIRTLTEPSHDHLLAPGPKSRGARSVRSTMTTSRPKSVHPATGAVQGYEDDDPDAVEGEPLGDKHKRKWKAFHEGRGVRTVVGSIGGIKDVRMLLKMGYRHVYVSRPFATRSGLIPKNSAMGTYGYAGLVNLGQLPITVGSKTEKHTVMISEEVNFDVVLGRSWMEKMGIKTDPLDQTHVSYYENNEVIPCDIVVLKDSAGQVITIT